MTTFSIVTVCYNSAAALVGTAKSVFDQAFSDLQYIVQDRSSSDATVDVVKTFGDWVDDFRSEPDSGVYQAMNSALSRCTGAFTLFLNPGDRFASVDVLQKVASQLQHDDDIVSGQAIAVATGKVHKYRDPSQFWAGSFIDPQATFVRTVLARELQFNESLKFAGELDFLSRARLRDARFRMIDVPVCRKSFAAGPSPDDIAGFGEHHQVLMKHFGESYPVDATLRSELVNFTSEKFDAAHRLDALKEMTVPQLLKEYGRLNALVEKPSAPR